MHLVAAGEMVEIPGKDRVAVEIQKPSFFGQEISKILIRVHLGDLAERLAFGVVRRRPFPVDPLLLDVQESALGDPECLVDGFVQVGTLILPQQVALPGSSLMLVTNFIAAPTRRGFDWTGRFPWIEDALRSLRAQSATIDGEAVYCGDDGISDFEKLHSRAYDQQVFLYAFDLLELNGEDCRRQSLERRKGSLERLVAGRTGVRLSEHIEGDGPIIFEHACKMGLEGIVSKRRDLPYRSGRVRRWIKVKNPASPAAL